MEVTTSYVTLEKTRSGCNYLFHSAPLVGGVSLGCWSHAWPGVRGARAVGVGPVGRGHRGDQRLDHPLQIGACWDGRDSGDEGGTWCCQVSEILRAIRQKKPSAHLVHHQRKGCRVAMNENGRGGVYKKLAGLKISHMMSVVTLHSLWGVSRWMNEARPALSAEQVSGLTLFSFMSAHSKCAKTLCSTFYNNNFMKA